eukprot:SAG25_NODE_258_length_10908_cov_53.385569_3_plen_56_part_00
MSSAVVFKCYYQMVALARMRTSWGSGAVRLHICTHVDIWAWTNPGPLPQFVQRIV